MQADTINNQVSGLASNMPKVSVIVPVFGVEQYIERCARSLFEQTLDDIEYIFIDDCTTDKSIDVLKEVLKEYPSRMNLVKIHRMKSNSGQAAVREWGIRHSSGEYVIHCDADDWVDKNLYEYLYAIAKKEDADMAVCDYTLWQSENKHSRIKCCNHSDKQGFFEDLVNQKESWSLWNKLVHHRCCRDNSIRYPQGAMGEDAVLVLQYVTHINRLAYCDNSCYYYYQNPDSITNSHSKKHIYKRFKASVLNAELLLSLFIDYNAYDKYSLQIEKLLFNKKNLLLPLVPDKKMFYEWKNTFRYLNYKILLNPKVSITERIRHLAILLHLAKIVKPKLIL